VCGADFFTCYLIRCYYTMNKILRTRHKYVCEPDISVMKTVASVKLLVLLCTAYGAWSGEGKTFELVLKDGVVLCATSTVSQTTSVNDLRLTTADRLPPQVVCARQCTSDRPCHSFNYRSDINSCHFYHYPPTVCQPQPHCHYFRVRNFATYASA